jgi:glycyl-tRNA synthetase beta chain
LLVIAVKNFEKANKETCTQVFDFMMDRLKGYYLDLGFRPQVFEAVLATQPTSPADFNSRIKSVATFEKGEAAESLAAANKRISNILKKHKETIPTKINTTLFDSSQETQLHNQLSALENDLDNFAESKNYNASLELLSQLKSPIDDFFDHVMVMTDNTDIRDNRLALLSTLYKQFTRIADISQL